MKHMEREEFDDWREEKTKEERKGRGKGGYESNEVKTEGREKRERLEGSGRNAGYCRCPFPKDGQKIVLWKRDSGAHGGCSNLPIQRHRILEDRKWPTENNAVDEGCVRLVKAANQTAAKSTPPSPFLPVQTKRATKKRVAAVARGSIPKATGGDTCLETLRNGLADALVAAAARGLA